MLQECAMKPDSISWALCPPDPKRRVVQGGTQNVNHPLRFALVVVPPGAMIKSIPTIKDSIYVSHKKFTLWTHVSWKHKIYLTIILLVQLLYRHY